MRKQLRTSAAAVIGLALGWGMASVWKSGPEISETPADQRKTAPGRPDRKAADLGGRSEEPSWRELLAASESPGGRHPLLRRFDREQALRRWIGTDPKGALAEAERDPDADFAKQLFEAWIQINPLAALDALNGSSRRLAGAVAKDFFLALMAKDPALAAEELQSPRWSDPPKEFLGWNFHTEVYRQWMRSDLEAAVAWLDGQKHFVSGRGEAEMEEWARMDFEAAWRKISSATDPDRIGHLQQYGNVALAQGLLQGNAAALEILGGLPVVKSGSGFGAVDPRSWIAESMVRADPLGAMEWAESRPSDDPLRREILAQAASAIASSDPERALALLAETGGSARHWDNDSVLQQSFAALAAKDPESAAARAAELPEGQRERAMSGWLRRVFMDEPAAVAAQSRAWLADPQLRESLPEAWAIAFSSYHGAAMIDPGPMLEAVPELHDAVNAKVLSTWSKANPEGAAGWISDRLEQGYEVPVSGEGVFADLAIARPEFTANWLMDLPDPALQAQAADTLTANWSAFDPVAAGAWVETLPQGTLREAAERGMEKRVQAADPFDPFR